MFSQLKYICVEAKSVRWEFVLQAQTFYLPCKNSIDRSTARDFTVFISPSAQWCVLPFRWIYYCHSSKSTRKETGKMHLSAVQCSEMIMREHHNPTNFNAALFDARRSVVATMLYILRSSRSLPLVRRTWRRAARRWWPPNAWASNLGSGELRRGSGGALSTA